MEEQGGHGNEKKPKMEIEMSFLAVRDVSVGLDSDNKENSGHGNV